jgi:hypothetical protein
MTNVQSLQTLLSTTASVSGQETPKLAKPNGGNGNGRHRHPRFRNGCRLAALRAFSGAQLVLNRDVSPADAADWVGSNPAYIRAMVALIRNEDESLINSVLAGELQVLTAAAQVKGLAQLLKAYAMATAETKAAFGRAVGIDDVFDRVVAPALATPAE